MAEAIRIAVLNFVHETVTFLPNDTTPDDFVYDGSPAGGEARLAWEPRRRPTSTFSAGCSPSSGGLDLSKFDPYGDVSFP